jgi:hypothetical protein
MLASIILPLQIEELALVARDVQAMGVPYDGGIKVVHNGGDVCLDRIGYPSCGGASLHVASLGLVTLWLFRALYLNQLPAMKHDGMFLSGSVCEIHLLLLAHRFQLSDGILKEV